MCVDVFKSEKIFSKKNSGFTIEISHGYVVLWNYRDVDTREKGAEKGV